MTTVRMDKSGILAIERAMWYARLQSITESEALSAIQIHRIAERKCIALNIPCISLCTIERYLNDMVTREMMICIKGKCGGNLSRRKYYQKVVK